MNLTLDELNRQKMDGISATYSRSILLSKYFVNECTDDDDDDSGMQTKLLESIT